MVKILPVKYREYMCLNCGHVQEQQTNHTGNIFAYCKNCSWKPSFTEKGFIPNEVPFNGQAYRIFTFKNDSKKNLVEKYRREHPNG